MKKSTVGNLCHSFDLVRIGGVPTAGIMKDVVMMSGSQEVKVDLVADNPALRSSTATGSCDGSRCTAMSATRERGRKSQDSASSMQWSGRKPAAKRTARQTGC